ncbi:MAG TPA: hypothetical protein VEX68_13220 [Bryobacteraceae bacterium]|nr:hypothetical protein [Bryobacteraceae bacterium]
MVLRTFATAVAAMCITASAAVHPALPEVKTVYLLPMGSGLDQYLANWLTRTGRFEVVTDPAKADAIFTDRLGTAFEEKWKEMYPPPEPPKPEPAKDDAAKKDDKKETKTPDLIDAASGSPVVRISSFSRGRGNIFIVSRKTGSVIWSHYSMPKDSSSKGHDDNAERIVDRLQDDLKVKN